MESTWLVGDDFNTIYNPSKRLGGSNLIYQAMDDFKNMILDCNIINIGFSRNSFIWNKGNMWQHIDRVLF